MTNPKYPHVHFSLSDSDGNSMVIIGGVRKALRRAGVASDIIESFSTEAMSGNYDHVLQTCMKWVSTS